MSGTRQHFVPRFMMRGFLDPELGPEEVTHVYRIGGRQFTPSIKNIGLENSFYGEPGTDSLDSRVTALEGHFGAFVHELRIGIPRQTVDSQRCAALCAHLAMRTRHLRLMSMQIVERFIDKIADLYQLPENREPIVGRLFQGDSEIRREQIEHFLAKNREFQALSIEQKKEALDFIQTQPRAVIEMMVQGVSNKAPEMLESLRTYLKLIVQDAHNKTLHKDEALIEHENKMREMNWILVSTQSQLILGDFILLVRAGSRTNLVNYLMAQEVPSEIFLPISSTRLLIGFGAKGKEPEVNEDILNHDIAANSYEYFIAASGQQEFIDLSTSIGEILNVEMNGIQKMMDDLINTEIFARPHN